MNGSGVDLYQYTYKKKLLKQKNKQTKKTEQFDEPILKKHAIKLNTCNLDAVL